MEIVNTPKVVYTGDGTTKAFIITFDYLRKSFVKAKVDNETVDYEIEGTTLTFAEAPADDSVIEIERDTTVTRLVSWADASVLKASDMTIQQVQLLHLLEEAQYWIKTYALILDNNITGQGITIPHGKGKGFEWNADGTAIVLVEQPSAIKYQCEQLAALCLEYKNLCLSYKNSASTSATSASTNSTLAKAWAESPTSPDGGTTSKSSKSWATVAQSNATAAQTSANYCKAMAAEGSVYDETKTYQPGDACMTPEGDLWRCVAVSTGESPSASPKWVQVSVVNTNTFEPDENGDLMPLTYPKKSSQFDVDDNGDIEPSI